MGDPIRVVLLTGDPAFGTALAERVEDCFEAVQLTRPATEREALSALERESVDCLIATDDASSRPFDAFLEAVGGVASAVPVVVLTDDPTGLEAVADIDTVTVADVRSRAEVAADPDYLLARLGHLVRNGDTSPATDALSRWFDHCAVPILVVEGDGDVSGANAAAVAFYRSSRAALTALSLADLEVSESTGRTERTPDASGSTWRPATHRLASGEVRCVEVNSTTVAGDDGGRRVLLVRDVTERVEAERGLRAARDRYQRLTEQSLVGIYTVEGRRFTYVNPRLAEMFGTTPEEMVGRSVFDYVADEDEALVRERFEAREAGRTESSHYVFAGRHPEKDRLVVEVHGSRLLDGDGGGDGEDDGVVIVGTMLDVTEREAYERELARLSKALEHAAPAVYITDADATIEYVNPSYERITGYSAAEAVGETPSLLQSGQMDDAYYRRMYATLDRGEVWEETIIDRRKNGELYHAYQTIAPLLDAEGTVEGYVAIQTDITARQIQEQVLQVFHRIFRHNLRNQLNVILGYVDLLESAVDGTEGAEYVREIETATETLESLSEKAIAVSETVGEGEPLDTSTDLVAVVERERTALRDRFPAASVTYDGPDALVVQGGGGIEVAVQEVLTNAVVHSDRDRPSVSVRLRTDEESSMARLEVRDDGPGLDDVELTTLRVGEETPLVHGAGIGLWLVEWVVTELGGHVEFTNEEPRGLTIAFLLPLADEE